MVREVDSNGEVEGASDASRTRRLKSALHLPQGSFPITNIP